MKLLKAQKIDYPKWYAEYKVEDLGVFMGDQYLPHKRLPEIEKDLLERGMVYPIIIFSPYSEYQTDPNPEMPENDARRREILRVYMGHKRIWFAKKYGYTHISAYHVRTYDDAHAMCGHITIREFCFN